MNKPHREFAGSGRIEVNHAGLMALAAFLFSGTLFAKPAEDDAKLLKKAREVFEPLPKDAATGEFPVSTDRVNLGRMLFFDPRISIDGSGSCLHCHQPALYGADALPKSRGVHDQVAPRNAPTVLNAGLQFKIHWDGVFENVEEQATKALLGPGFGNPDHTAAMARVKAIPGYSEMFQKAFPGESDSMTAHNWGKAIGAYERTLVTPSRFDEYLGGESDALSAVERRGLSTFIDTGCAQCHDGPAIGGGRFEKFGVVNDYWNETGSKEIDQGRFKITNDSADLYQFKVAGLRNVAMTPPYFHDGSVGTLTEAVRIMAKVQLGTDISENDTSDVVAFLRSLTGKLPDDFASAPVLPPAAFDPMLSGTASKAVSRPKPEE
ncbi:MAG TPA: cytochrome c peroxidase [Pirellulales bacterium]|nr:cytochrome c peroxidase [Pirellulales bacterium]